KQARQIVYHIREVQRTRLHDLFTAEHQQLPGQVGRPIGRQGNLTEWFANCRIQKAVDIEHVRMTADHRQQVVEIVSYSSRQLADRFHLLQLPDVILQTLALGDVVN